MHVHVKSVILVEEIDKCDNLIFENLIFESFFSSLKTLFLV